MKCIYILFVLSIFQTINAQEVDRFKDFKNEVRVTWANGNYVKSIELLETNKNQFLKTSEQHTIIYYLGLLYLEIDEYQKSFEIFKVGFKQHFFFSFWPNYISKMKKHTIGKEIIRQNEVYKALFQKKSSLKYEVKLPENYSPNIDYPLLYFMHGNNSNIQYIKDKWKSISLSKDLIVVFVQSSHPKSNFTFDWIDNNSDSHNFQEMHQEISNDYSINNTKIIMSGFSNGARKAIDLFNNQPFQILGFIAFNPSTPKSIIKHQQSGRSAIITGEKDYMLSKQIEMASAYLSESFPLRLVVIPNHKHDYPKQFEDEINNSVEYILQNNE